MLSRLPISLAQLKAGNNSEKLKSKIRQLLYSLNRSKKLHRFKLNLTDKLNLENPNKNMALANLSIYYNWKNIKSEYKTNKFKISAPSWNDTFDLPDDSYSISDIQDHFEFIIKNTKL